MLGHPRKHRALRADQSILGDFLCRAGGTSLVQNIYSFAYDEAAHATFIGPRRA
jgi:hypothetical protein